MTNEEKTIEDVKFINFSRKEIARLEYENVASKLEVKKLHTNVIKGYALVGVCGALALYSGDAFISTLAQNVSMDGYMKLFASGAVCGASSMAALFSGIHMVANNIKEKASRNAHIAQTEQQIYTLDIKQNATMEQIIRDYTRE